MFRKKKKSVPFFSGEGQAGNLLSWCSTFSTNLNSLGASGDSKVQCSTLPFFFLQFIKTFTATFIRFRAHIHDLTVYFVHLPPSRQQFK